MFSSCSCPALNATKLRWLIMTPLARPVVPPVALIAASASGSSGSGGNSGANPLAQLCSSRSMHRYRRKPGAAARIAGSAAAKALWKKSSSQYHIYDA